jgi:hypothetical protein
MTGRTPWLAGLLAVCTLFCAPALTGPALAHDAIAFYEQRQVGPYLIEIGLDRDPPRTGQDLALTVRALPGGATLQSPPTGRVTVIAVPGPGTDATQTRLTILQPEAHDRSSYAGEVRLPVRGAWTLEIEVGGAAGPAVTSLPIDVDGPPPIPVWLGWLVGLSPLAGLAWFARWNRTYLRNLLAEAA